MDLNDLEILVEKYWRCETSLEEEQQLRTYFQTSPVSKSMKGASELFRFFEAEKGKSLQTNFEATVTTELRKRHGGKIVSMVSWGNMGRIAAGIVVVVAFLSVSNRFIKLSTRCS